MLSGGLIVMNNIIEIRHLYKTYKDIKAVNDLSFCVKEGEFFAFLGVNGAGKSTTISIMCGELTLDSGEVLIDDIRVDKSTKGLAARIGVVFQNSLLDKDLTVYDNLKYRAGLYGIFNDVFENRLNQLAQQFRLNDILKRPIKKLSGGQKRRVDIVRALLHNPKILILDEPTTGLDPQTRALVWENINDLRKKQGLTVFLTTHYMEEASDADYVIILDSGKICGEGTPHDLKNRFANDYVTVYHVNEEAIKRLGYPYEIVRDGYRFALKNTAEATKLILANPELFKDYEIIKGKMDDVFLNVTGKKLVGGNN